MEREDELILTFWGYHGTLAENAKKIKQEKEFRCKENPYHWLGNGVYFFIDDPDKAIWWAKQANVKKHKKQQVAYIRCYIQLLKKELLNLDIERDRIRIDKFFKDLHNTKVIRQEDSEDPEKYRTRVLDFFIKRRDYKAIKYTFSNTKITYENINYDISPESDLYLRNNGCQLAIFNQSVIDFSELRIYKITESLGEVYYE